jgi:ABC-type nickel/cobalt efflux system permease component RcnA
MSRVMMVAGAVLALGLGLVWLLGGFGPLQAWVLEQQREVQNALAGAVRAIKGGQPKAVLGLLSVCFAYGFLHAAGPGHGKLVIGGYGMARRVPFARLAGVALASSLAQAAVAVGLVYAVVALLGLGRSEAEGLAEEVMAPLGTLMVAGVGLWLVWRGAVGLRAQGVGRHARHHVHQHGHAHHDPAHATHSHGAVCDTCGHAHGPTVEEVQRLTGWRDTLALVAGIAMRPCSGALFLLILTWQLGIATAGIIGTFAMGLGTAMVTIGVVAMAVWAREGALASLPGQGATRFLPWFEIIAGLVVAVAALSLLTAAL